MFVMIAQDLYGNPVQAKAYDHKIDAYRDARNYAKAAAVDDENYKEKKIKEDGNPVIFVAQFSNAHVHAHVFVFEIEFDSCAAVRKEYVQKLDNEYRRLIMAAGWTFAQCIHLISQGKNLQTIDQAGLAHSVQKQFPPLPEVVRAKESEADSQRLSDEAKAERRNSYNH